MTEVEELRDQLATAYRIMNDLIVANQAAWIEQMPAHSPC